ncbi:HET-domain-containing protein [Lepidopterella palustris CBS 459.81]|uniref:HET-domain-containing protein n=1 Tax=Lepidopterella palustris CBS 459.81 TaxID=1314670 RepID=A0A8E2EC83_9PEZI|nr:HET-domain-containing protein [Lepidopterella palustris CBS 459.81]
MGGWLSRELRHQPLEGPRHIRLLECLPKTPETVPQTLARWLRFIVNLGGRLDILEEPLITSFQLQHFELDACPPFYSLSYAWGDPTQTHTTLVSGSRIKITKSLRNVLRDVSGFILNTPESGEKHKYFWVDGICINQKDEHEKNIQVTLMGEIYQKAATVITYTGPEDNDTRPAIELAYQCMYCLKHLWPDSMAAAPDPGEFVTELFQIISSDRRKEVGLPPVGDPKYRSLCRLLRMPWSSRAWIIQESVMNQKNMMMCGTVTLENWGLLGEVVQSVNQGMLPQECTVFDDEVELKEDIRRTKSLSGPDYVHMLWSLRAAAWSDSRHGDLNKTLLQLLRRSHSFQSTDARDKIFALIGMARDREDLGIEPAYHKPARDIYIETAVKILDTESTLDLLSSVRGDKQIDLPSWVPDWSTFDCMRYGVNNCLRFAKLLDAGLYQAGSAQRPQVTFSSDSTELTAKGLLFDELRQVYFVNLIKPILDGIQTSSQTIRSEFKTIKDRAYKDGHSCPYANSSGFKNAFSRTLAGNVRRSAMPTEGFAGFEEAFDAYLDFHDGKIPAERDRPYDHQNARRRALASLYYQSINELSAHRAIGITRKGYIASVPQNAREGDYVCVLYGGRLPYIVRQVENGKFMMLGDSYVDGIMKGEAVGCAASDDVRDIIFI